MTTPSADARAVGWEWDTPRSTGAISICRLLSRGGEPGALEGILHRLTGQPAPCPGAVAHRRLADIDDGVIVRLCDVSALVMPHGGIAIRRALDAWFAAHGATQREDARGCHAGAAARAALRTFPEARSPIEALALGAIGLAASPRAIPLLLAQESRHRAAASRGWRPGAADHARARRLSRLLRPPLVVAVGAANAGKSSLLNAVAGRTVAIAADLPGTTRDCVAGRVMLDGLAVDWLDTPGIRDAPDAIELRSRDIARTIAQRADLVIGIDAPDAPLPADCSAIVARAPDMVVGTKSDLAGPSLTRDDGARPQGLRRTPLSAPLPLPYVSVSATARTGLEDLAIAVRRALVPDADIESAEPWAFDTALA